MSGGAAACKTASATYTVDDAIERCGNYGRFQWCILGVAGFDWMASALQVMLLAFLGPSVECAWGLSPAQLGVLTSVVFAGMTVGGPLWGCIADGWGRRTSLIIAVAWLAAFGFASAAAQSFAQLLALRFFVGMGLISKSVSFNLLMEFSPVATRGFFLITVEGFWVVGTVVQAGLAHWLLDTYGWRILVVGSTAPLVLLLAVLPFVPESPRYLLVKGRTADAQKVLARVLRVCGQELPEGELKAVAEERTTAGNDRPVVQRARDALREGARDVRASICALCTPQLRYVTISLFFTWFANAFVYYGLVQRAATVQSMGSAATPCVGPQHYPHEQLQSTLITSSGEVPGLVLSLVLAHFVNRKHAFAIPTACIAAVLLPLLSQRIAWSGTVACLWLARMFSYAAFNLLWALTVELFPTSSRSFALGITNAMGSIGGLVSPYAAVVAPKQAWAGSAELILVILATAASAAVFAIPRDMNKQRVQDTLEELREISATERAQRAALHGADRRHGSKAAGDAGAAAAVAAEAGGGGCGIGGIPSK